jgi:hypothetical protein
MGKLDGKKPSDECKIRFHPLNHFILYILHHKALQDQRQNTEGLQSQEMDHHFPFVKRHALLAAGS